MIATEYSWFVRNMLLDDDVTVLVSPPGAGKGQLCMAWAAGVTNGKPLVPGGPSQRPGSVILISPEDRPDTLEGRKAAVGANTERIIDMSRPDGIHAFQVGGERDNIDDLEYKILERKADPYKPDVRMVIVDGINACLGVSQTQRGVRPQFDRLLHLARTYHVAIILIAHFTKDGKVVAGSGAWVEAARTVLEIKRTGDIRTLLIRKSNIAVTDDVYYYGITGQGKLTHIVYQRPQWARAYIEQWEDEHGPKPPQWRGRRGA